MSIQTLHFSLLSLVLLSFVALANPSQKPSSSKQKEIKDKGTHPVLIKKTEANYPDEARAKQVGGLVMVEFWLDENGNVTSPRIVIGHSLLREAALEAARDWKFEGVSINGQPVKLLGSIIFCFQPNRDKTKSRDNFSFEQCCPGRRLRPDNWCKGI
jgi:TonB family protein